MLKQNRFGGLPTGEIRYQNTLLAFNTGTKWNLSFWFIIIAAFIVEIVLIRSAVDGRNAEGFVNQKNYRISACEVEEIDEFYYTQSMAATPFRSDSHLSDPQGSNR